MDEELKQKLNESLVDLINWMEKTSGSAEEFLREQTPLLVQEILVYYHYFYLARSLAFCFGFLICLIYGIWAIKKSLKIHKEDKYNDLIPIFGMTGGICLLGCIFIPIGIGHNILYIIKINVAPRLFLIEKLKDLL